MSDYPKEELDQLQTMWKRIRHEWRDGNGDWEFDPPPALADACASILHRVLETRSADMDDDAFSFVVEYGQAMFSFGQYCHQNGLYRNNMTMPDNTKAKEALDSELEKILKDA